MGCGSRAGKTEQHSDGKPEIDAEKCRGCKKCLPECANGGLVFDEAARKMGVDKARCVGCGRCLGACNFDAIDFAQDAANADLNRQHGRVREGRRGRPAAASTSRSWWTCRPTATATPRTTRPSCRTWACSPPSTRVALDQACVDACLAAAPLPGSKLSDNLATPGFEASDDHFTNSTPESEWRTCLEHAEKIGLGTRDYELVRM